MEKTRERRIELRATEKEYRAITKAAAEDGMSITQFVLSRTGSRAAVVKEIMALVARVAQGKEPDVIGALDAEIKKLDALVRVRDALVKVRDEIAQEAAETMRKGLRELLADGTVESLLAKMPEAARAVTQAQAEQQQPPEKVTT